VGFSPRNSPEPRRGFVFCLESKDKTLLRRVGRIALSREAASSCTAGATERKSVFEKHRGQQDITHRVGPGIQADDRRASPTIGARFFLDACAYQCIIVF
jgi:hypothetical protein